MALANRIPWKYLDEYRGEIVKGEWPTIPEMLTVQVKRFGDRPLFTDFEGPDGSKNTLTYAQSFEKILQLAKWMIENGIQKGDKVAVSGKNSPEWAIVYLAALFASAIIVPIDNGLTEAEVINLVKTAEPKIFIADDEKCVYLEKSFPKMLIKSLNPTEPEKYVYNLHAKNEVALNEASKELDTAAILFTSGTTGTPKGVMLSHRNLACDPYLAQTKLLLLPTDVFYALLPLHHAYTMQAAFLVPITCGAEIVFGKSMAVTRLMRELKDGKITIMLGVPLLYNKLLAGINKGIRAKGVIVAGIMSMLRAFSFFIKTMTGKNVGKRLFKPVLQQANIYTLRIAICGGGPLATSVYRQYNAMGIQFIQGYGLTETSPIITLTPIEKVKVDSIGQDFYPYAEIKIINAEKRGRRSVGEIAIKGPMVMQGYYKMPEETAAMFTEDSFLKTGDLGWMDKNRFVRLCGRAKNLIVTSGGKNVYPEEVEDAFQLYYNDIQQITVRAYYKEGNNTSEEIEALIYPSEDLFKRLGLERNSEYIQKAVYDELAGIVSKVNKTSLKSYSQVTRLSVLKEALETTTTMKVKRNLNPAIYEDIK